MLKSADDESLKTVNIGLHKIIQDRVVVKDRRD